MSSIVAKIQIKGGSGGVSERSEEDEYKRTS